MKVEGLWKDEPTPMRAENPCEQARSLGGCNQNGIFELIISKVEKS